MWTMRTRVFLLSLCLSLSVSAETIVLKSGRTVEGKIIEQTDEYIKLDYYGVPLTYFREDIAKVEQSEAKIHTPIKATATQGPLRRPQTEVSGDRKHFLWKVETNSNVVYLLGSIHFATADLYPLAKPIEDAFADSDILAVEANVYEGYSSAGVISSVERGFYQGGQTLSKSLSPSTYSLLKTKLAQLALSIEFFEHYKPWMVALTLEAMQLLQMGYDPLLGIDMYFLAQAQGNKKIVELESIEYQFQLFDSFSEREQEIFLRYALEEMERLKDISKTIIKPWQRGDTKAIETFLASSSIEKSQLQPIYQKLFYERNENMVAKIEGFLRANENHFVVVGAGHLIAEQGIVALLRAKGYSVEQL